MARITAAEKAVVAVLCGWEFVALTTGLLPTISSQVRKLPEEQRAALAVGVAGWLARDWLMVEEGGGDVSGRDGDVGDSDLVRFTGVRVRDRNAARRLGRLTGS